MFPVKNIIFSLPHIQTRWCTNILTFLTFLSLGPNPVKILIFFLIIKQKKISPIYNPVTLTFSGLKSGEKDYFIGSQNPMTNKKFTESKSIETMNLLKIRNENTHVSWKSVICKNKFLKNDKRKGPRQKLSIKKNDK